MADDLVPLLNGTTVTLDEFLSWSPQKQAASQQDRTIPDDVREKISATLKGTKHGVPVPQVMTPKGLFRNRNEAAAGCGFGIDKMRRLIKNSPTEYYLVPVASLKVVPQPLQPSPPSTVSVQTTATGVIVETAVIADDDRTDPPTWFKNYQLSCMKWQRSTKYVLSGTIPYADAVSQLADDYSKALGWDLYVREIELNPVVFGANTFCHIFVFQNVELHSTFMQKYA